MSWKDNILFAPGLARSITYCLIVGLLKFDLQDVESWVRTGRELDFF